jgi:hypothetical protein
MKINLINVQQKEFVEVHAFLLRVVVVCKLSILYPQKAPFMKKMVAAAVGFSPL